MVSRCSFTWTRHSKIIINVTTFYNNIDDKNLVQNIRFRIDNVKSKNLKDVFQDVNIAYPNNNQIIF